MVCVLYVFLYSYSDIYTIVVSTVEASTLQNDTNIKN